MIGNDIVDITLARTQSNWRRKGFLEKQFTDFEIERIVKSQHPFMQVWLFWSMKEAAYKIHVQQYQKRFFAAKKFQCSMISKTSGVIKFDKDIYFSSSIITENYIHTIVLKKNTEIPTSKLFLIDEKSSQTAQVSKQLLLNIPLATAIQKNEFGVPFLYKNRKKLEFSVSTSHHGNYGGFAIVKSK